MGRQYCSALVMALTGNPLLVLQPELIPLYMLKAERCDKHLSRSDPVSLCSRA